MTQHISIKMDGISKKYQVGETVSLENTLRSLNRFFKNLFYYVTFQHDRFIPHHKDYIWAVKDVSLEAHKGEIIGIIGKNGSGKSTLLKIISRITKPTEGYALIRGSMYSMLEVGTGFNEELTGRQNIFLNGVILGFGKKQIASKFEDIVDYSGVREYLDTPIKRYSSGMRSRLGFAIAAHLETDIMIIDEVLSVGDAEFQKKCLERIEYIKTSGKTVIIVSHDVKMMENLCSKIIWMEAGHIKKIGDPKEVLNQYLKG